MGLSDLSKFSIIPYRGKGEPVYWLAGQGSRLISTDNVSHLV